MPGSHGRPWVPKVGAIVAVGLGLTILGNWIYGRDAPQATDPLPFTQSAAAVYTDIVPFEGDQPAIDRILVRGGLASLGVSEAEVIGTARLETGEADLVSLTRVDASNDELTCLAVVIPDGSGEACSLGEMEGTQVSWGLGELTTDGDDGDLVRSVTMYNAPDDATAMYVVMQSSEVYVGSDVLGGIGHVVWDADLGEVDWLVVVDADGTEVYSQILN